MFSPNRKSLKENKSEQTKFIASETGKRKSKGKGKRNGQGKQTSETHADVPQTRESEIRGAEKRNACFNILAFR